MSINTTKSLAVAACATAILAVSACGSSSSSSASGSAGAGAQLVGSGCAAYAKKVPSGAGSVDGMAKAKVAEAASANPLLTTLVKAVSGKVNPKVNLVDVLDGGQYTVFAPVDAAFAKIPAATLATLSKPANAKTLSSILTYHVLKGQIAPGAIAGTHKTLEGGTVSVKGSGDNLTVNGAKVICGGVKTANATVYLIDAVMMPKM
ncbi:MAG: fasciclin domain-containing protein [Actinomycetota bacterium]|nr:fasciclin domain-containing protein [Actinomycetota bacterium]